MSKRDYHRTISSNLRYKVDLDVTSSSPSFGSWTTFAVNTLATDELLNISSVSTSGYKQLKKYQLPDNPHLYQAWHSEYSEGSFVFENFTPGTTPRSDVTSYEGRGVIGFSASERGYLGDDPSDQAISRLQSQVSLSSGSLAVGLAEAHKTAKMVAETATKFVKCIRALRRGNLGVVGDTLGISFTKRQVTTYSKRFKIIRSRSRSDAQQFAASRWLEVSYGWKPLLADIKAQAENTARIFVERQFVTRVAKSSAKTSRTYVDKGHNLPYWYQERTDIIDNTVRYTVRYAIPDGPASVAAIYGLENPLLVAWELVPFSFVVDWFLPVGNFLESMTAYRGLVFHSGTKTFVRKSQITCKVSPGPGDPTSVPRIFVREASQTAFNNTLTKSRTPLTAFPTSSLPSFKDPRSFAHAASAIALIQSVFRGSGKYR